MMFNPVRLVPIQYRIAAVALTLAASHAFVYWKATSLEHERWRVRGLEAKIANLQRDIQNQKEADAAEAALNKQSIADAAARETELNSYVDKLRADKTCRRALSADDAIRLRKIDGGDRR